MSVLDKSIGSLVEENFIYARALHYLGIAFFEYEDKDLRDISIEKGLSCQQIVKCFYDFDNKQSCSYNELERYPLPYVIAYLRHSHFMFIKEKLPFIDFLLENYPNNDLVDLKVIFPVFVENFVHHIHEEEDVVFKYVDTLISIIQKKPSNILSLYFPHLRFTLQDFQNEHLAEDETGQLRDFIDNYTAKDLHGKIIIQELKSFDREVLYHAAIENEIFFKKALKTESKVFAMVKELSICN